MTTLFTLPTIEAEAIETLAATLDAFFEQIERRQQTIISDDRKAKRDQRDIPRLMNELHRLSRLAATVEHTHTALETLLSLLQECHDATIIDAFD